jgi:hypothetical protein
LAEERHYGTYQQWQVTATLHSKNITQIRYFFLEKIVQADHCYCAAQKHRFTFIIFYETITPGMLWVWTKNSERRRKRHFKE